MQPFKVAWGGGTEDEMKDALAEYFVGEMQASVLYILGPGTTMEAVGRKLGIDKTLLGVDAVYDWKQVAKDADEAALLALLDSYPDARIVVTPIGQQGFIFGRGNQQISPEVIWKAGVKNVVVLATPLKMRETRTLRVDTGDILLDDELRGYQRVIVEYGKQLVATVR
ncbi:ATP-NAD kinase family protein [Methanomassiliicoccus luminyensis]|uniref:ATP-NAD kinase family protein n=1 Tax=Methanomassiliicoccus luminyensis TaxID=1080712 RepID=UPI00035CB61C|nr:NAD(+)/NADH kinase [Methanomassiliicoccus luminyensis]